MAAVTPFDLNCSRLTQWEQRHLWRNDLLLSDAKNDIARLYAGAMGRAARMNILECPAGHVFVGTEESSADRNFAGRTRLALVIKAGVADPQFLNQIVDPGFKLFRAAARQNVSLSLPGDRPPFHTIEVGIVELALDSLHYLLQDGIHVRSQQFIRSHNHLEFRVRRLSPTIINPPQSRGVASVPNFWIIASFACCSAVPLSKPAASRV